MMPFTKRAGPFTIQLPKAQVLQPSGKFEGDDGKWSTFTINIAGDGESSTGQNFRVLISTSSPITMVPKQPDWCSSESCASNRGIMSYGSQQQPLGLVQNLQYWKEAGIYDLPQTIWSTSLLPFRSNGTGEVYGLTTVGLGEASKASTTLPNQYVASTVSRNYFLGSLGLSVGAFSPNGAALPTFFSSFAQVTDLMPSNSYGFAVGASYRNGGRGVPGSMVFGGYDKSRYVEQGAVSIPMPSRQNNTLVVGVQSILYAPKQDVQARTVSFTDSGAFSAIIDSSLPYLVLPNSICDQFVQTFGLAYDRATGLFTVNSTAHERNIQQNGTVSFRVGSGPKDTTKFATIVLPYAAFDLQASAPIYDTSTNYFPIKNTTNGVYVLGRTFLQEAYLIVDYERANFTVAPARYADPTPAEDIVTIYNSTFVLPKPTSDNNGGGLSAGAIAGIVVGIVALFLILGVGAFFYWKKRRDTKAKALQQEERPSEIDTTAAGGEIKQRRVSELTGSDVATSPGSLVGTYYGADHKKHPAIAEMSPESQPAELYSPPPGSENEDYFVIGPRPRRRGATRDSTGNNTPGTPVAELAGDYGQHYEAVSPLQRPEQHSRSPSDTSLTTNIDEIISGNEKDATKVQRKGSSRFIEHTGDDEDSSRAAQVVSPLEETNPTSTAHQVEADPERRPSHTRGLSDNTINSESTAVSQPTPEEMERWHADQAGSRRPLSQ